MSPEKRRLSIKIESQETGPGGLPMLSFAAGEEPVVFVEFTFENEADSRGSEVIARFQAGVDTKLREKSLARKEWKLDVPSPKPGYLSQGRYTRAIALALDPRWPSSTTHWATSAFGWVRYKFSLTVDKIASPFSLKKLDKTIEQEFWITLPGMDTLDKSIPPTVFLPMESSPVFCHIQSNRFHAGQVVPFEFRFTPLEAGSPYSGEKLTIVKTEMELRQEFYYFSGTGNFELSDKQTVVSVVTTTGWPTEAVQDDAWERVLYMVVPGLDKVRPSFKTRLFHCVHKVKVRVIYQSGSSSKMRTFKDKFDVHISPGVAMLEQPEPDEDLPVYSNEGNVVVSDQKANVSTPLES
ncbi:hypothetical protein BGZ73_001937 [Actinomortierella ambigua]|nr:hypothetical protein BGZ73_001937 [Actinomortierella ambigua]